MSETGYLQLPDFQHWFDALTLDDHEFVRQTLTTYFNLHHSNQDILSKQHSYHDNKDSNRDYKDNQESHHYNQDNNHDNQDIILIQDNPSHHDNQDIILIQDNHGHHGNQDIILTHELLNGQFIFPPLSKEQSKVMEDRSRKLSYPLTLAAVHGAARVLDVLLDFGVDVHLHEIEGNNLLHCLVDAASLDTDRELDMIKIYEQLRRRLSVLDLSILLREENGGGVALRPLEYAAYMGTLQLMFALWGTPGVYVVREEIVDVSVYQWYDITEYTTLVGNRDECRYLLSPIVLIAELTELQLTTQFARDMFEKGCLIGDWVMKRTDVLILNFFFALRILYVSVFSAYDMHESWLRKIGGISSDTGLTPLNMTNNSFIYCKQAGVLNYPESFRNCMLVFLIINAIAVIAYDITSIVVRARGNCQRYKRFLNSQYSGAKARYINLTFSMSVFAQIILLNVVTERGWGTVAMDLVRLETTMGALLTSQYFLRTIPGIGQIFTYMWKASSDLFVFGWFILDVIVAFSRLEMLYVNTNSLSGCAPQFANFYISLYTQFLTFLNMQDYTQISVRSNTLLFIEHITFVFVVGVMLFNLLLAISNDTVNRVYRDKEMMTSLGRLFVTMEINVNISRMPLIGGLYSRYFHAWRVRKTFVCEGDRVFLVKVRKNRRQIESAGLSQ